MQIALQVIAGLLYVLAILQKKKWQMMLIYTLENVFLVAMYFSFGRTTVALLNLVAMVRTFILCVFALKNIKPNIFVLIISSVDFDGGLISLLTNFDFILSSTCFAVSPTCFWVSFFDSSTKFICSIIFIISF